MMQILTGASLSPHLDEPVLLKLACELVQLRPGSKHGSIHPIVQNAEHIEDGRQQLEYHWLLDTARDGEREPRVAFDRKSLIMATFEDRPYIVGATQKDDIPMPGRTLFAADRHLRDCSAPFYCYCAAS
jgi:hypothetical protein